MNNRRYEIRKRIASVKSAVNKHGESNLDGNSSLKKPQEDFPQKPSSKARDLHMARRDMSRYKESKKAADLAKVKAESELLSAREKIKDLASLIEETNLKAVGRMRDIESLRKNGTNLEQNKALTNVESYQYAEVLKELKLVKQELSKLKLDMASAMGDKTRTDKDFDDSSLKSWSNSYSADVLRKQFDALKEVEEFEAQQEKEAGDFTFSIEETTTKEKREDRVEEKNHPKDPEQQQLAVMSDVNLLKDELKKIKKQDKMGQSQPDDDFQSFEEMKRSISLESIMKELEEAKKELVAIRDEGLQYVLSMDIIKNELKHVTEETAKLKKIEEKTDVKVKSLNSKLLKAKTKLETVTAAEEKAKSIVTNLSLTLEQLRTEADASKKEKLIVTEDTTTIKENILNAESEIYLYEEILQEALKELEEVKASEAEALEKLRTLIKTSLQSRDSASKQSSTISISKFEYEYLTGRAAGAEEIADKKVAAAQAWIETFKASEREILMKTDIVHKDHREMKAEEEEHEVNRTEKSRSAKEKIVRDLKNWGQTHERKVDKHNRSSPLQRRSSMKNNGNTSSSGRAKLRKPASPAKRGSGSTPLVTKKNTKVMPNLAKFFNSKKAEKAGD